jgi:hypothetical protein
LQGTGDGGKRFDPAYLYIADHGTRGCGAQRRFFPLSHAQKPEIA